jgi:ElaB/YqjD/DUF883 family membrane-anchored ribosome-binding protein
MKLIHVIFAALLLLAPAIADDSAALKSARQHFGLVATRATANFKSADNIEERLKAQGSTLHPSLVTLRLRIEAALDKAEAALGKGDVKTAVEQTRQAEGMLDKFAKKLGGE